VGKFTTTSRQIFTGCCVPKIIQIAQFLTELFPKQKGGRFFETQCRCNSITTSNNSTNSSICNDNNSNSGNSNISSSSSSIYWLLTTCFTYLCYNCSYVNFLQIGFCSFIWLYVCVVYAVNVFQDVWSTSSVQKGRQDSLHFWRLWSMNMENSSRRLQINSLAHHQEVSSRIWRMSISVDMAKICWDNARQS